MCGRFVVSVPDLSELASAFGAVNRGGVWLPHYNIAPTQLAPVVTNEPERTLAQMHFGLEPFWARKKAGKRAKMINARVETIARTPAYKNALELRRCIIPVSGYYEWQQISGRKQPLYVHARAGKLIPLSGVWERWRTRDGEVIESFAIVTRPAEGFLRDVHDRMPLEVPEGLVDLWLDPAAKTVEELAPVLHAPAGTEHLVAHPVSTLVNAVANDAPELIEPVQ